MTEKQLYATVMSGQRITFEVFDSDPVDGYLAGLDSERMFVLQPRLDGGFRKRLIARSLCPVFEVHSDKAYATEPDRDDMDKIIGPFRQWVGINVMSRQPKSSRPAHPHEEKKAS